MMITRKTKVPLHWVFFAQLPFTFTIWAGFLSGTPFLYSMKKFIENPAAITFLMSFEAFFVVVLGPFINWLSDRVWTRFGRRKPFISIAMVGQAMILPLIPLAPDLYTLVALRWIYSIIGDLSTPNQPLTMEIVPPPQRGRGSGFFSMQIQLFNLLFWGVIIGRFDDVYFMGPMHDLFHLNGEMMMYVAGTLSLLTVFFMTALGVKEIRPPKQNTIADITRAGGNVFKTFCKTFFGDIFSKDLTPLYMILFVNQMVGLGLGVLGPLLYTDQWGYSLQDMGTNVAIGAFINIFIAMAAGYFADKTSKMRVYVICLLLGLALKFAWVFYVWAIPGHRPQLWEILLFGEMTAAVGLVASTVTFPLIFEYVERNRFGAASAGMGIFNQVFRFLIQTFVGLWIVGWSIVFLPQAGSLTQIVFRSEQNSSTVQTQLTAAGLPLDGISLRPSLPPGRAADSHRHWEIRTRDPEAQALQERKDKLANRITKLEADRTAPWRQEAERAALAAQIADLRREIQLIDQQTTERAARFRSQIVHALQPHLVPEASQIISASWHHATARLAVRTVEPLDSTQLDAVTRGLRAFDLLLTTRDGTRTPQPALTTSALPEEPGIILEAQFDTRFLTLHRAWVEAGASFDASRVWVGDFLGILRGALGNSPDSFSVQSAHWNPAVGEFTATLLLAQPLTAAAATELAEVFTANKLSATSSARVDGHLLHLLLRPTTPPAPESSPLTGPLPERLRAETHADDFTLRTLLALYRRLEGTAEAKPVYATIARPVVAERYAPRVYDYFFSVYFIMILTDFFGLAVIWLLIRLEKKGVIHRYGLEEDAHR